MNEPKNFLYCIIGSFILVYLSGCVGDYADRDIYITDIGRVINKSNPEEQYVENGSISNNQNKVLHFSNKSAFVNNNHCHSYNYRNKGSYSSCCYTVKPGDTLFYIAWITGNNYHDLAKRNNISVDDILKVGQILQVGIKNQQSNNGFFRKSKAAHNQQYKFQKKCVPSSSLNSLKLHNYDNNSANNSGNVGKKSYLLKNNFINLLSVSGKNIAADHKNNFISSKKQVRDRDLLNVTNNKSPIGWVWPAYGKIISAFSSFEGGKKGIDISGTIGQSIFSAAAGKVVYAGNALVGYGNLIIIKHNDNFLSTYAHNDKILVIEQQYVYSGQKIATMGNSESDMVKLYFEIRYRGKSVDPLHYLPKR